MIPQLRETQKKAVSVKETAFLTGQRRAPGRKGSHNPAGGTDEGFVRRIHFHFGEIR